MEQIIGKLSEIETTAETIMKDALQKKKALSAEMERQSKEFDTQLEKQTEGRHSGCLKSAGRLLCEESRTPFQRNF